MAKAQTPEVTTTPVVQNKMALIMQKRQALKQAQEDLDAEEQELLKNDRPDTLALVKQIISTFKFKPVELFPELRKKQPQKAASKAPVEYKYYDPESGAKWAGRGATPEPFASALKDIKGAVNRKAAVAKWLVSDSNPLPAPMTKSPNAGVAMS